MQKDEAKRYIYIHIFHLFSYQAYFFTIPAIYKSR